MGYNGPQIAALFIYKGQYGFEFIGTGLERVSRK